MNDPRTRCTATTRGGDHCDYAKPYGPVCALHALPETRPQFRPRSNWDNWHWRDQGPRKFAVGNTVLFIKPATVSKHASEEDLQLLETMAGQVGTIRAYVELDADNPEDAAIDLELTGPIYEIEFTPDQDVEIQVAEAQLSPAPDQADP